MVGLGGERGWGVEGRGGAAWVEDVDRLGWGLGAGGVGDDVGRRDAVGWRGCCRKEKCQADGGMLAIVSLDGVIA